MSKYATLHNPGWWNGQTPGFPRLPMKEQKAIIKRNWKARRKAADLRVRRQAKRAAA